MGLSGHDSAPSLFPIRREISATAVSRGPLGLSFRSAVEPSKPNKPSRSAAHLTLDTATGADLTCTQSSRGTRIHVGTMSRFR